MVTPAEVSSELTGANERIMHVYECKGTEMCEVNAIHNVAHVHVA